MSALLKQPEDRTAADRRISPRVAARLRTDLFCLGVQDAIPARSSDIGSGGVCVETSACFDPASLRRIAIELPDETLRAKAIARWQCRNLAGNGFLTGIGFPELEARAASTLLGFVSQRAQEISGFLLHRSDVAGLELDEAMDLALFTRVAEFPSGTRIYEQGTRDTRGDSIFVVFDGPISLEATGPGGVAVAIEEVGAGGVFGGLPLIGETPHTESAIALSDAILLEIDPYTFTYLQAVKPHVVSRLRTTLIRKKAIHLRKMIERLE